MLTFSGLSLFPLGTLATWSFRFPKAGKRNKARRSAPALVKPAE
ncbi:MAG: hypothetical protein JWL74_937 [Alphaproteobacteria bacterium]|jgi:hypothetical protein|nr:hypothetical protein [Alphaproteobacteria bacterium]